MTDLEKLLDYARKEERVTRLRDDLRRIRDELVAFPTVPNTRFGNVMVEEAEEHVSQAAEVLHNVRTYYQLAYSPKAVEMERK